jgi:hypothetical protein
MSMPCLFEEALEAQIGHHGGDHAGLAKPAVFLPALRDHREQLVAVDDMAALVDQDDPVGVAIERECRYRRASRAPSSTALPARSSRIPC